MTVDLTEIADFERSISSHEAIGRVLQSADQIERQFGVTFKHYEHGTSDVVYVEDSNSKELTYGLGKGVQSIIGAYGECIEHFFYSLIGTHNPVALSRTDFLKSYLGQTEILLRFALTLDGVPETFHCQAFKPLDYGEDLLIPREFINYHFLTDLEGANPFQIFLSRYSTTSGTAFGLTRDDAILHAINELLERDVTSEFLIRHVIINYKTKNKFVRLDTDTLGSPLTLGIDYIYNRHMVREVEVYSSQTCFGGWWSLCVARFGDYSCTRFPQWGAGYSLSYDLAIYRSIAECGQMLDHYSISNSLAETQLVEFLEECPRFFPVCRFESPRPLRTEKYNPVHNIRKPAINDQLQEVASSLRRTGRLAASNVVHESDSFCVVSSYIPNLERFFPIFKGVPALPLGVISEELESFLR